MLDKHFALTLTEIQKYADLWSVFVRLNIDRHTLISAVQQQQSKEFRIIKDVLYISLFYLYIAFGGYF